METDHSGAIQEQSRQIITLLNEARNMLEGLYPGQQAAFEATRRAMAPAETDLPFHDLIRRQTQIAVDAINMIDLVHHIASRETGA